MTEVAVKSFGDLPVPLQLATHEEVRSILYLLMVLRLDCLYAFLMEIGQNFQRAQLGLPFGSIKKNWISRYFFPNRSEALVTVYVIIGLIAINWEIIVRHTLYRNENVILDTFIFFCFYILSPSPKMSLFRPHTTWWSSSVRSPQTAKETHPSQFPWLLGVWKAVFFFEFFFFFFFIYSFIFLKSV